MITGFNPGRVFYAPALLAIGFFLGTGPAYTGEINTGYFGGVAIKGYDPVAYFTERRAVRGSEDYAYDWLGATWHFANAEHREVFATSPVSYAPQYGGHCADGISYGGLNADIDPEAWRIIDGKLYLNYDQEGAASFEESPGKVERADAKWTKIQSRIAGQ